MEFDMKRWEYEAALRGKVAAEVQMDRVRNGGLPSRDYRSALADLRSAEARMERAAWLDANSPSD